jgi:hypothetical protein
MVWAAKPMRRGSAGVRVCTCRGDRLAILSGFAPYDVVLAPKLVWAWLLLRNGKRQLALWRNVGH